MKVKLNEAVVKWKRKKTDAFKMVDSSKSAAAVIWDELDHIILDFETGLHYSFLDNGKITK